MKQIILFIFVIEYNVVNTSLLGYKRLIFGYTFPKGVKGVKGVKGHF